MYTVEQTKATIERYLNAVYHYGIYREWDFNGKIRFRDGTEVDLFSSDLNLQLNKYIAGKEHFFLSFHANRFNPHEKNLFLLFFEIYDQIIHKETNIFLVKYHVKPYIIENLIVTGIPAEAVYSPSFHFQKDVLLIDADKSVPDVEQIALLNLQVKKIFRPQIEKFALLYFFERLLQKEGLVASFCKYLLTANNIDLNLANKNLFSLPVLMQNFNTINIPVYNETLYSELEALLGKLEVEIDYRGTNQQFTLGLSKLVLAPILNEMYLKLFEYFVDSEFPFICNRLLNNIRLNKKNEETIQLATKLYN